MALTFDVIRHDPSVKALIEAGNEALGVLGFTDHGYAHAGADRPGGGGYPPDPGL